MLFFIIGLSFNIASLYVHRFASVDYLRQVLFGTVCLVQVLLGTLPIVRTVVQVLFGTVLFCASVTWNTVHRGKYTYNMPCLSWLQTGTMPVMSLLVFFGILVPSMQHSFHLLHANFFWLSPGMVTSLVFSLHVCHASAVTAAFRDPFVFFPGVH